MTDIGSVVFGVLAGIGAGAVITVIYVLRQGAKDIQEFQDRRRR